MEKESVDINGEKIVFFVQRKNVKNINLKVNLDKKVTMSIPMKMEIEIAKDFIKKKAEWIKKQQNYYDSFTEEKENITFENGETVYLLGKQYKMKIISDIKNDISIKGRYFEIHIKERYIENKRYIEKIAFLIMTSEIIILLSNKYEVILKMNIVDITKVELKYNGKYFEFVSRLNEDKYKIILINKQNNLFACELYFILEKILFKERNYNMKNTIKKIPLIKRFKSGLKENIKKKKENEEEDISENA